MTIRLSIAAALVGAGITGQAAFGAEEQGGPQDLLNVYFAPQESSATVIPNFDSMPDALVFHAAKDSIICSSVSVMTADGQSHAIYDGEFAMGEDVSVDVPAGVTEIARMSFTCRTGGAAQAQLHIGP